MSSESAVNKNPKLSNLKPFPKGVSGNPKGGQKKIPALDKLLSDVAESDFEAIISALFAKAKKGDVRAAEVILDRSYGKPKDNEGKPTEMVIRVVRNS